jgi:hypothetical protein
MFSLLIGSKYELVKMVTVFFVLSFSYDDESTMNEQRERERERERESGKRRRCSNEVVCQLL